MSLLRYILPCGLLLLGACADEPLFDNDAGDGVLRFAVADADEDFLTRGSDRHACLEYHASLRSGSGKDTKWFHIESAENPVFSSAMTTRANPNITSDFDAFTVYAEAPNGEYFINNQTVSKTATSWETEHIYYWPQKDVLNFYARPVYKDDNCKPELSNVQMTSGSTRNAPSFRFSYTVPHSADGNKDAEEQPDILLATHRYSRTTAPDRKARIRFKHPLAGICFVQDKNLENEEFKVTKVTLRGFHGSGNCVFNGANSSLTGTSVSRWTLTGEANESYTEEVELNNSYEVYLSPTKKINAVAPPFMIIPHTKEQLADAEMIVELDNGDVRTLSLRDVNGFEPGKMYVITVSNLDAKYPPINNLQGMAGNNTVSLNWENPEPTFPHVHQCGVTIKIIQKGLDENENEIESPELTVTRHWNSDHPGELYPSDESELDLFCYITEGLDADGNTVAIDTKKYREFEVRVITDYYNIQDDAFTDPSIPESEAIVHQSVARTLIISPNIDDDIVLFYIPEGAGTPAGLLDDDDKAAWDWFVRTYPNGMSVTKDDLGDKMGEILSDTDYYGNVVLWIPCGVQLRGKNNNDFNNDYISRVPDDQLEQTVEWMRLANDILDPSYGVKIDLNNVNYGEFMKPDGYGATLKMLARTPGLYNNGRRGTLERVNDVTKYFTDADIEAVRSFYGKGGNLLLTTFSIELVYEFGVIPYNCWRHNEENMVEYRPFIHLSNEIKPSSVWFVRNDFGTHRDSMSHPLYKGMFKCQGSVFPECKLDESGVRDYPDEYYPAYVGSDGERKVPMYPLLSMGADACENNNVVWDFTDKDGCRFGRTDQGGKSMADMERDCNGRFIGTWGQISDDSVGVIFEFYPGQTDTNSCYYSGFQNHFNNHGRCIAIGLGAYEFNNGLTYYDGMEVTNRYQSNIQRMTKNALDYLIAAPANRKAP